MVCQESQRILGAYVDNEIDLVTSLALEDHLSDCSDCTYELEKQRSVKDLLRNMDLRPVCPPGLRQEILESLTPKQKAVKVRSWPSLRFRMWTATAAVAAVLLFAVLLFFYVRQNQRQVLDEVVDNHIRSLLANHLADVASTDQHTVKPWFNGKLDFAPKVQDFTEQGYPLVGGRLDYMENQTVSVLVYKRRQHVINVFIHPSSSNSKLLTSEKRGYNVAHWAAGGMEYWAVSDLNAGELQEFTALLRP